MSRHEMEMPITPQWVLVGVARPQGGYRLYATKDLPLTTFKNTCRPLAAERGLEVCYPAVHEISEEKGA